MPSLKFEITHFGVVDTIIFIQLNNHYKHNALYFRIKKDLRRKVGVS